MIVNILLIVLGVIVLAGLIRVCTRTNDNIWDFIMDMFWIDILGDLLVWIIESLFDND